MASKRIPIRISPMFFLTAALIGFINTQHLMGTLVWVGIIFVSILVHEFGHALAARAFGQSPMIELTAFGGLTYPSKPKLSLSKEFIVTIAGPFFGICLFIFAQILIFTGMFKNPSILYVLNVTSMINLIWTLLNLLPVMPLDGGQLMRIIFEGIFGYKGRFASFITSMGISIALALLFIFLKMIIISVLFFFFAFQNFEYARQVRSSTQQDEDDELKNEFGKAQSLIDEGKPGEAEAMLTKVRNIAKEGMIFQLATQELAKMKIVQHDYHSAYDLLKPHLKKMSDTARVLLHEAAFEVKDYPLVLKLASSCIVNLPDQEIVLRSAMAAAMMKDIRASLGWLQTAKDYGCENLPEVVDSSAFDPIREDKRFQEFVDNVIKTC